MLKLAIRAQQHHVLPIGLAAGGTVARFLTAIPVPPAEDSVACISGDRYLLLDRRIAGDLPVVDTGRIAQLHGAHAIIRLIRGQLGQERVLTW